MRVAPSRAGQQRPRPASRARRRCAREHALLRRPADGAGPLGRERPEDLTTSSPLLATSTSRPGSRKSSMPSHASVTRHAAAPAASKTQVAGEKPTERHAVAGHVQHRAGAGVEGVVIRRVDVPDVPDVRRASPCPCQPLPPRRNRSPGSAAAAPQEELLHARSRSGRRLASSADVAIEIAGLARSRSGSRGRARCRSATQLPRAERARSRAPPGRPPP